MHFAAGQVIRRREVLHGLPWMEQPFTVVLDRPGFLAVLVEPGSRFTFPPHPFGPHPWAAHEQWTGTTVLQLHRDGDAYALWKVFDGSGVLLHWYVNVEAPIVRRVDADGGGAFETGDHGIDIVIPADGAGWQWKDVDDPERMVAAGRLTRAEADAVMRTAHQVAALLDAGDRWWSPWDDWMPGSPAPAEPVQRH